MGTKIGQNSCRHGSITTTSRLIRKQLAKELKYWVKKIKLEVKM